MDLPDEVWRQIFDLAADEDVLFQYALPTNMAESAWFKNIFDTWTLRSPMDAINLIQRRSYATKKAIIRTCKNWRRLGSEFLFRCLFFSDPSKVQQLCRVLDSSSAAASTASATLGWWTKRIHIARYYASSSKNITMSDLENAVISIIRHCPNLEIFLVDWPMGNTFGPVADTLTTMTPKSLRTVYWNVPVEAMHKVIWALDSLPTVLSVHLQFAPPDKKSEIKECIELGAASDLHLTLPYLQLLSVRGHMQEFVDQAIGWSIPSLRMLTLDNGTNRDDQPDAVTFLEKHGSQLIFLDIHAVPSMNVPQILQLCPLLQTFSFNADWRIQPPGTEQPAQGPMSNTISMMSTLVARPHENITTIGLHGLLYAFGVGYGKKYSELNPLNAHVIRRSNDMNVAALNKANFPNLRRVRVLNSAVLLDLNDADGPSTEDGCLDRYNKWWDGFAALGVRLEDCTGALLGTLPQDEPEEEEDSEEEYEYEWEYGESYMEEEEVDPHTSELRKLLEECRVMNAEREEPMFPIPVPTLSVTGPM